MIGKVLGLGTAARQVSDAVTGVAEVFVGNRAERDAHDQERFSQVVGQFCEEFQTPGRGFFDQFVNGMNRLPRPMMAIGTLGLFSYSMLDPYGFSVRMQGLAYVPDPLWWLLGAVVSFYFGARELHHYRGRKFALELAPPPGDVAAASGKAAPAGAGPTAPSARPAGTGTVQTGSVKSGSIEIGAVETRTVETGTAEAASGGTATVTTATVTAAAVEATTVEARAVEASAVEATIEVATVETQQPAAGTAPSPPVAVRAADPEFNAAFEEWRRLSA